MNIKQQCITGYLTQGVGCRQLAKKYGVSRNTINKCVQIHQGIHNIAPTEKQQKYYLSSMNSKPEKTTAAMFFNHAKPLVSETVPALVLPDIFTVTPSQ